VAFAFGLAAATIFPALLMGIFYKRLNKEGAIAGMLSGLFITLIYIINYKFINIHLNTSDNWFLGISPEGFGFIGMIINFVVALCVSYFFNKPPDDVYRMVDKIRQP
ncbi:MAG: cation acetate symporter, partial [SAR86 cluster bacterium]|nr:cation acetate symporter [SAR86 cluster bacterium]